MNCLDMAEEVYGHGDYHAGNEYLIARAGFGKAEHDGQPYGDAERQDVAQQEYDRKHITTHKVFPFSQ